MEIQGLPQDHAATVKAQVLIRELKMFDQKEILETLSRYVVMIWVKIETNSFPDQFL